MVPMSDQVRVPNLVIKTEHKNLDASLPAVLVNHNLIPLESLQYYFGLV